VKDLLNPLFLLSESLFLQLKELIVAKPLEVDLNRLAISRCLSILIGLQGMIHHNRLRIFRSENFNGAHFTWLELTKTMIVRILTLDWADFVQGCLVLI
jgi:hypothetical protein